MLITTLFNNQDMNSWLIIERQKIFFLIYKSENTWTHMLDYIISYDCTENFYFCPIIAKQKD